MHFFREPGPHLDRDVGGVSPSGIPKEAVATPNAHIAPPTNIYSSTLTWTRGRLTLRFRTARLADAPARDAALVEAFPEVVLRASPRHGDWRMAERDPSRLFSSLTEEFSRFLLEQKAQLNRDVLTFPSSEGDRFATTVFSGLSEGGFCTLVVTGRRQWDPRNPYYQAARFAARRGCKIHRAFLLPHRHLRKDPVLLEHMALDAAAGIQTEVLFVGDLIATLALPLAESLEFGIWDGVVGCIGLSGPDGLCGGITEWRATSRVEDLQTLEDIKKLLRTQAQRLDTATDLRAPELEEPMIATAPVAHEMAAVLCQGDHVCPEDCSWYHGVWQYLRIFNMVSTPTWHTKFYLDALQRLAARDQEVSILISGTADYSMLAHVLWAFRSSAKRPRVTVLDLCETPLFLCKWYGKTVGERIETVARDIMSYSPERPFDAIVTDAFLTRFSPVERPDVARHWHDILRPGGEIITTIRIEPGLSRAFIQATPEQADAFRRRALQEARRWHGFLAHPPEYIANRAQRYAERMTSYSMPSEGEARALLESVGFVVSEIQTVEVPGEMAGTKYVEVVACRSKTE